MPRRPGCPSACREVASGSDQRPWSRHRAEDAVPGPPGVTTRSQQALEGAQHVCLEPRRRGASIISTRGQWVQRDSRTIDMRQRLAAIAALLALALALVVAVVALHSNLGSLVLCLVLVIIAAVAGWYVATRRGALRVAGSVVALVSVALIVVVTLRAEHSGLGIVAIVVLAGLSASMTRFALGRDPRTAHAAPPGVMVGAAQRGSLIINPKSGGGKAERFRARRRGATTRHRSDRPRARRRPAPTRRAGDRGWRRRDRNGRWRRITGAGGVSRDASRRCACVHTCGDAEPFRARYRPGS